MPREIDPIVKDILQKYHPNPRQAIWDCHGTWVVYHKDIELIAVKAGVTLDMPTVIEANGPGKSVAICVRGSLEGRSDWSIGEASSSNCKNAYLYAMAEKRARDRVILKLIGLHGFVYSEEEADDFKAPVEPRAELPAPANDKPKSSASLKRDGAFEKVRDQLAQDMLDVSTFAQFEKVKEHYRSEVKRNNWNAAFQFGLSELFGGYEVELQKRIELENAQQSPLMAGE